MNKKQTRQAAKAAKATKAKPAPTAVVEAAPKAKVVVKEIKGGLPPLPKLPSASRSRKPKPQQACVCGCGGMTRGVWVPGHDARAKGYVWRFECGIMKMADVPANEQAGVKFVQKMMKDAGVKSVKDLMKKQGTSPKPAAAAAKAGTGIKLVKKTKTDAPAAPQEAEHATDQPAAETTADVDPAIGQ